jgi:hypothetical protein
MPTAPTTPWPARWEWRHPDPMTRAFTLVADGLTVGELAFTNLVGSRATGRAYGTTWDLQTTGFFQPHVEGRLEGTPEEAPADFTIALDFIGTGHLHRAGEPVIDWSITAVPDGCQYAWVVDEQPLVGFVQRPSDDGIVATLLQTHGSAVMTAAGAARSDLPLLLVTGWYLVAGKTFDLVRNPPSL